MTLEFKENRTFSREDYAPYIGKNDGSMYRVLQPLPNAEDVDPLQFLNNLASGGHMWTPVWAYAKIDWSHQPQWTQFFLTSFMGLNDFDGGGYAVTYGNPKPSVKYFRICQHEVQDHPGANHSRGWHPGHCVKCGMNMTYDSGD